MKRVLTLLMIILFWTNSFGQFESKPDLVYKPEKKERYNMIVPYFMVMAGAFTLKAMSVGDSDPNRKVFPVLFGLGGGLIIGHGIQQEVVSRRKEL